MYLFLIVIVLSPLSLFFICVYQEFFLPFMFSLFGCFGQYLPSASLMPMVERNPGGIGEVVVIRDRLRSETARRRRLSLFPAAAVKRRLLGFACPPRYTRLGSPSLPRRWHARDCTCGLRTPALPVACLSQFGTLSSLRPTKPNSKGGSSQRPEQSLWFPVQLGEGSQPGSQEGHWVSGSRPLPGAPFSTA